MAYGPGLSPSQLLPIQEIFSAQVMERYQSSRRLAGVCMEQSNTGGGARHDWLGPKVEMTESPFGAATLPTTNVQFSPVVTIPKRFILKTAIAMADQSITNVDLRSAHTEVHGLAAARMVDILLINSIFSNPNIPLNSFKQVPITIGPNTGINTKKLTKAATDLNNADVPLDMRYYWSNSDQYDALLNDPLYNSWFTNTRTLPDYSLKPYANFEPRMLALGATNSIPTAPDITQPTYTNSYGVAMQFSAMKLLFNIPMTTTVWLDGANRNYVVVTELVANANIMQIPGVVLTALQLDSNGDPIVNTTTSSASLI